MEDNSVIFAMDSGQCSEDEEDDFQRKEELHQLLSEQLHDDLLDDTMSTSIDGEISLVSTPHHSQSLGTSPTDVTPNASPSHDNHLTSHDQFSHAYSGTSPHLPYDTTEILQENHPVTNNLQTEKPVYTDEQNSHVYDQGTEQGYINVNSQPYQEEADLLNSSDYKLQPPLPLASLPSNETSDVFAGTSQAYKDSFPLASSTQPRPIVPQSILASTKKYLHKTEDEHLGSGDPVVYSHDIEGYSHDPHNVQSYEGASDVSTYSESFPTIHGSITECGDVTNGYPTEHAQILTSGYSTEHAQTNITDGYPTEHAPTLITNVTSGFPTGHAHNPYNYSAEHNQQPPHYPNLDQVESNDVASRFPQPQGLTQLEVLYDARGRQINELSQQLAAKTEDAERHVRILRHEKVLIESEREELTSRLQKLEAIHHNVEESLSTMQGQLAAEKVKSTALETNKAELISRLQAAEATVNSLTDQVTELTSSDTLSRIRDNYSQALSAAAHEHKQEVLTLQQENDQYRECLDDKDQAISHLQQEIKDLQNNFEKRQHPSSSQPAESHDNVTREHSSITQPEFGCEVCEGGRMVELVGQVEDLTFQLSTTQEELEQALERVQQAETELKHHAPRLSEYELENLQLSDQITTLQAELVEVKVQAETEKKAALEHCRSACLKLHEDSTQRLKETVDNEKQRLTLQTDRQVAQLKSDLATIQEQYVAVCMEKERVESDLTQLIERDDMDVAVQEAVGVAKVEWEWKFEEDYKLRLECALKEQEEIWQKRVDSEKEQAISDIQSSHNRELIQTKDTIIKESSPLETVSAKEQEEAIRKALRQARLEWLNEKEVSLSSRVDSAVSAAQKLWKEQHLVEMEKLKKHYEASMRDKEGQRSASLKEAIKVEQKKHIEEAIVETKQECDRQFSTKLKNALSSEKRKWGLENDLKWKEHEQTLIATAHREWSTAQEAVLKAEVERSKQEWEELHELNKQNAVKESLLKAKQHYEGVVQTLHTDLSKKFDSQKSSMTREIQLLESRVASLMQQQQQQQQHHHQQQHQQQREVHNQRLSSEHHRQGVEGAAQVNNTERLKGVLKNTSDSLKREVISLLADELEAVRKQHRKEIAHTRESTAKQVKEYYLQCLHQLVNTKSHDVSHDKQSRSHGQSRPVSHASPKKEKRSDLHKGRSHDTEIKSRDIGTDRTKQHVDSQSSHVTSSHSIIHHKRTELSKHHHKKPDSQPRKQEPGKYPEKNPTEPKPTLKHTHSPRITGAQSSPSHRHCVACEKDTQAPTQRTQARNSRQVVVQRPLAMSAGGSVDTVRNKEAENRQGSKRNLFGGSSSLKSSEQTG